MVSTVKVTNIDTPDNTGNVTFDRPIVGDGSGLTSLSAANLTGALPAISGASLTGVGATVKIIGATYDTTTASGTQDVTGFGFNPSAIWGISFYNIVDDWAMGFTDFTSHRMLASSASTTGVIAGQVQFPYIMHSGGNFQLGVASSITDGFRITWTKVGTPTGTLHMYFMGIQ